MSSFEARKRETLSLLSSGESDNSPKGNVDVEIAPLLGRLNAISTPYISTSSCSGRVALCAEIPDRPNQWLLVSHSPIHAASMINALTSFLDSGDAQHADVKLVFEPFIIACEARDLTSAGRLWQAAVNSGCRESGIQTSGREQCRTIVTIRTAIRLEVPLVCNGIQLVDRSYIEHLCDRVVVDKFARNTERIASFAHQFEALAVNNGENKAVHSAAVVIAPKAMVSRVLAVLEANKYCDVSKQGRRVRPRDNTHVIIPITTLAYDALVDDPARSLGLETTIDLQCALDDREEVAPATGLHAAASPLSRLQRAIPALLSAHHISAELAISIPKRWERLGDLALLPDTAFTADDWGAIDPMLLWQTVADCLRVNRVARQARIDPSTKRHSRVQLLLGDDGWVHHLENGIHYELDVTKTMFCSGNGTERIRMGTVGTTGEVIVDLFAGIGYLSIPALLHGRAAHLHACEWNVDTLIALRRSLKANAIAADRYTIYEGDNRIAGIRGIADRVLLGLIPSSEMSWQTAVVALKEQGGWLHVHANAPAGEERQSASDIARRIEMIARHDCQRPWAATLAHVEVVKSYAPHILHVVADIHLTVADTRSD